MHGNRTLTLTTIQSSWHQSVLVRALGATVFGLSAGGIPMEAAHANVYRARARATYRHCAFDSNAGLRAHSAHKGQGAGQICM